MINRECVFKIVKSYLPDAQEDFIIDLTIQAERQIEALGKDVIRKLVLRRIDQGLLITTSKIDTKV